MTDDGTAARYITSEATLDELREVSAGCQACDLYRRGTQTVFGDGAPDAHVLFVGEQPGDEEDRQGEPFVGPAGRELDRALESVGIDRDKVYITNVVKHFKWKQRGRRRLHETPNAEEIDACRPWLDAEIDRVRPKVIVALGATAAKALLGRGFRVTKQRGDLHPGPQGSVITATVHPSSILRAPTDEDRYAARAEFTEDVRKVATLLREGPAAALRQEPRTALYERARELEVAGRSRMVKAELVEEVAKEL